MSLTLGGNVVIRNGNELDFCWRECIQSLLPICDKVLVCDGESTDGTQEEIRDWMIREPKIVLAVYPWPNPKGDWEFFYRWINYARQHVPCDYQLQLDADEILSEKSYGHLNNLKLRPATDRFSVVFKRHNFWRDTKHLIPPGVCLGHEVVRIAPVNMPLASDGYHPEGAEAPQIAYWSDCEIFHYGFLRKREQFFKKERLLAGYFFDTFDQRLAEAEKAGGNWMEHPGVTGWENNLKPFSGEHPAVIRQWLKERGYEV